MSENDPLLNDNFVLRVRIISHILWDVCRCHLFTDPRNRCSRCDILTSAAIQWPYEYELTLEAYNEQKAKGN